MRKIVGVGVSAGIAIGIVKILSANDHAVERRVVDDSQEEVARFRKAQDAACQQLKTLRDKTAAEFGEGKAELFDAHQLMLRDPDYVESIESMISGNKVNAEFAVNSTAEQFVAMDNSYMQVRAVDIKDVSKRLLNVLEGKTTGEGNDDGVPHIVFADDLAPSETVQLDRTKVLGFVTAKGSSNSHTAILARTMGLPAIIGIGDGLDAEYDGKTAIVDGTTGTVFVDPDEDVLSEYQGKKRKYEDHLRLLQELKGKPSETKDGQRIRLYANIGRPSDVTAVLANDAEGVGLFRSEFLYLESEDYPTENSSLRRTVMSRRRWATVWL